jgi:hypothetical protein
MLAFPKNDKASLEIKFYLLVAFLFFCTLSVLTHYLFITPAVIFLLLVYAKRITYYHPDKALFTEHIKFFGWLLSSKPLFKGKWDTVALTKTENTRYVDGVLLSDSSDMVKIRYYRLHLYYQDELVLKNLSVHDNRKHLKMLAHALCEYADTRFHDETYKPAVYPKH